MLGKFKTNNRDISGQIMKKYLRASKAESMVLPKEYEDVNKLLQSSEEGSLKDTTLCNGVRELFYRKCTGCVSFGELDASLQKDQEIGKFVEERGFKGEELKNIASIFQYIYGDSFRSVGALGSTCTRVSQGSMELVTEKCNPRKCLIRAKWFAKDPLYGKPTIQLDGDPTPGILKEIIQVGVVLNNDNTMAHQHLLSRVSWQKQHPEKLYFRPSKVETWSLRKQMESQVTFPYQG